MSEPFELGELLEKGFSAHECPLEDSWATSTPSMEKRATHFTSRVEDTQTNKTETNASPFFNQEECDPQYVLKKERPEHRFICYLAAQGFTSTEIAKETGFTTAMIHYVRKQPWAQTFIANAMEKAGHKLVMQELQGSAREAAKKLVKIMRGEEAGAKVADIAKAANDILNRCYGTAPQVVMHSTVDPSNLTDEELAATVSTGTTS